MTRWILLSAVFFFFFVVCSPIFAHFEVLSSNDSGIVIQFDLPSIDFDEQGFPEYRDCGFIDRYQGIRLPMSRIMVAVPPDVTPQVSVLSISGETSMPGLSPEHLTDLTNDLPDPFPKNPVDLVVDGYIRSQRVVILEFHPFAYHRRSNTFVARSNMTVRVMFDASMAAFAPSLRQGYVREPVEFESLLKDRLINYEQSRRWRKRVIPHLAAPSQQTTGSEEIKIYIERTGVYRLTYDELLNKWGIDLSGVDPRTLQMFTMGEEIPLYISGESDGSFDKGDYIAFMGVNPRSPYTKFGIYWLRHGNKRGLRVSAIDVEPKNQTATSASAFPAKVHFEENHLHSVLAQLEPEENSFDALSNWYESTDHWFWTGIRNGTDENEMELKFRLFDVAKSFTRPKIRISIQGGTPTPHDVIVSLNSIRIDRAQFANEDGIEVSKLLPSNSLIDAVDGENTIRFTRIDTSVEQNTKIYPYHVYLNNFDVEYIRLYRAVAGRLDFGSPEESKVVRGTVLEYTVEGFLNKDIDVFIHDGNRLLSVLANPSVEKVALDESARNRLMALRDVENLTAIPDTGYLIRFQHEYLNPVKFYAASGRGALKPTLVEKRVDAGILDVNNSANYMIITHPVFMSAAQRLADWRRSPAGGGFDVAVIDVTQIYDRFNYGFLDPDSIKEFLKYVYENWSEPRLTYVTIIGDATNDFYGVKTELYDRSPELLGYIPTHLIWSGYGETATDHWFTALSGNDALSDIYLGRIPVETPEEAEAVVDKILRYEQSAPNGEWRRRIVSIADDETTNSGDFIFKQSLSEIDHDYIPPAYINEKIFLDDIRADMEANPDKYGGEFIGNVAKKQIVSALDRGAVLAQYAGHAGRFVWAHEIIFDRFGVEDLAPNDKFPFMLVYSCYNGYFDDAGQNSMAEMLLRRPDAGIIGMFSATRQTYGSANDALSKIAIEEIFWRGRRRIGEIAFNAKLETLLRDGLGQLEVMLQYTLFGDAATSIVLPNYRVEFDLPKNSYMPGETLSIPAGEVVADATNGLPAFSGQITAQLEIGGRIITGSRSTVTNGSFGSLQVTIPTDANPGEAIVRLYGESQTDVAVGGQRIGIAQPFISDITAEVSGSKATVTCRVSDPGTLSGVRLRWADAHSSWSSVDMSRLGSDRYSVVLDLSGLDEQVNYEIEAVYAGQTVRSKRQEFKIPSPPDFSVVFSQMPREPIVYLENGKLAVEIQSKNEKPDKSITVSLYSGNPARDFGSVLLGESIIDPADWVIRDPRKTKTKPADLRTYSLDPLNSNWLAKATFSAPLPIGDNFLFVVVDSENAIEEPTEEDNTTGFVQACRFFSVTPRTERLHDPANRFDLTFAANSIGIQGVEVGETRDLPEGGQGSVEFVPAALSADALSVSADIERFPSPMILSLKYDYGRIAEAIRDELGTNYTADLLRQAIKDMISETHIYEWVEELKRWRRVDSQPVLTPSGDLLLEPGVVSVSAENRGAGGISQTVSLTSDRTPSASWLLIVRENNLRLIRLSGVVEDVGVSAGYFERYGLQLKIDKNDDEPFVSGDTISFVTDELNGEMLINNARTYSFGNGVLRVTDIASDADVASWVVAFLDESRFVVIDVDRGLITNADKTAVIGDVGREFTIPGGGVSFVIDSGTIDFRVGDTFRITVNEIGEIKGEIHRPGIYALMRSNDEMPPEIAVSADGRPFANGDYVSSKPNIAIAISDDSGVDPDSFDVTLRKNLVESVGISPDKIIASTSQGGTMNVNIPLELEPATYELLVQAADLDGHLSEHRAEFVVSKRVGLSEVMNYPNPFEDETEISCVLTSQMDEIEFKIYTLSGRLIWKDRLTGVVGYTQMKWDGTDMDGRQVANGVYYCKLLARKGEETFSEIIKLMRLR